MSKPVEQFGKYMLLERVAAGGMAEVYLAKSTGASGVNKFVAIKRILPQYSDQQEYVELFKEEAKIAVNLNHGNVVSIYDFGVEKHQFYLVMEYVEGRNLRQILNELKKTVTQLTIEQIVFMIKEVAAGLDHAHRCIDGTTGKPLNIVHRDISPQNIMVSFEGEVKIIDFGIAKAETQIEATKAGTLKGKYGYMSPEQADGQQIDTRTDIFSLGIVLWELLANDRLFTASSEGAILRKVRECQVPSIRKINPSVPPELERIVNKILSKDRSLRYQTAASLHRDLNRFLNTQYPEFSPHDFSVFMKNAFSTAFLEQRRKLVEFAKIQAQQVEEKTIITNHTSKPEPPPTSNIKSSSKQDEEDFLQLNTATDIRVNLEGLKAPPKHVYSGEFTQSRTRGSTKIGAGTQIGNPSIPTKNNNFIKSLMGGLVRLSIFAAILFGGYMVFQQKLVKSPVASKPREVKPAVDIENPRTLAQGTGTQQIDMPSTAKEFAVSIYSFPERARIVINGVDTGTYTPAQTRVKANTPFTLQLVKEGYTDLVTTITPTNEAYIFRGTLQRIPHVAYLVVNILYGGLNPELSIGGVPVALKKSGEPYIIQANVGVRIQARNKTTGLSAETTVSVPKDQRKIIDLILK